MMSRASAAAPGRWAPRADLGGVRRRLPVKATDASRVVTVKAAPRRLVSSPQRHGDSLRARPGRTRGRRDRPVQYPRRLAEAQGRRLCDDQRRARGGAAADLVVAARGVPLSVIRRSIRRGFHLTVDPKTVRQVLDAIRAWTDHGAQRRTRLTASLQRRMDRVKQQVSGARGAPPPVYFQLWSNRLHAAGLSPRLMASPADATSLTTCAATRLNPEALVARDPSGDSRLMGEAYQARRARRRAHASHAVKRDEVCVIDQDLINRPGRAWWTR